MTEGEGLVGRFRLDPKVKGERVPYPAAVKPVLVGEWLSDVLKDKNKPTFSVPYNAAISDSDLRLHVCDAWIRGTLTFEPAMDFLYREIPKFLKGKLQSDWESFGILIGKARQEITPLNIASWSKEEYTTPSGRHQTSISDREVQTLVGYILSLYRMIKANQTKMSEYIDTITNSIHTMFSSIPWSGTMFRPGFSTISQASSSWMNSITYKGLVAATDMFFSRFQKHLYSGIRIGTITAAFEDCTMLGLIDYFPKVIKEKQEIAMEYVYDLDCIKELHNILKPDQEIGRLDSYTVYMRSLNLVSRSPYSVVLNKNLHTYIHMLCGLMGQKRSLNARLLDEVGNMRILQICMCVAFCFTQRGEAGQYYFGSDQAEARFEQRMESDEAADPALIASLEYDLDPERETPAKREARLFAGPGSLLSDDIFLWMKELGFRPTSAMIEYLKDKLDGIEMRPDTIGEFIVRMA